MTINQPFDPDDVANMLINMKFDCKLGYKEIVEAENAKQAIKRWSLFDHLLVGNEKHKPHPLLPEDRISDGEL
jgi:hypothetical protein